MIEIFENAISILCTGVSASIALYYAGRSQKREWTLLGLFSCAFLLGDIYWTLYYLIYSETPFYSYIPDLSWASSFIFLILFLLHIRDKDQRWISSPFLWLIHIFTIGMCVFFMSYGDYLFNIVDAVLMTVIIWECVNSLIFMHRSDGSSVRRCVYIIALIFCAAEYAMWIISCFWMGDTILNPYYWFSFISSACFIILIPATVKAVGI